MYVRCRTHLTAALSVTPSYLQNAQSTSGLVTDYRDWQIPLGRRFRALKIWFVMRTYGVTGLQEHVRGHIALGEMFAGLVKGRADLFEVLAKPAFALTVLRVRGRGGEGQNELTKTVYERVNERGEIYLTSTTLPGRVYAIRVVSANPKAEERFLRRAFEILVEVAEEVRGRGREGVL